jgi:hypothetical protein
MYRVRDRDRDVDHRDQWLPRTGILLGVLQMQPDDPTHPSHLNGGPSHGPA